MKKGFIVCLQQYLWPVSYTHLDVYKRQVLHLITKIQLLKIRSNKLLHHGKSIKLGALDNITREKFSKTSGNSLKYISYQ